jgi:hypothetical protein
MSVLVAVSAIGVTSIVGALVGVAAGLAVGLRAEGELRGPDHAVVAEVQVQPVVAAAGHLDQEVDLRPGQGGAVVGGALRVDVQVGEVSLAQGDQVAVGAEIGLQVGDRLAVAADGERDR